MVSKGHIASRDHAPNTCAARPRTLPPGVGAEGGKLRVLDLFSGIGGFSLGLERTGGFETVAFCEIEPFCRRVLAKHWPEVPCFEDVRTLTADALAERGIAVDVICGGFPCQDVSSAGRKVGIGGWKSALWSEFARLIGQLRPRLAIVENSRDLRARGFDIVLGDLAALGYDAEWHCIPASAVDAPHTRDRVWIVAHADSEGQPAFAFDDEASWLPTLGYSDAYGFAPIGSAIARQELRPWPAEPGLARVAHGVSDQVERRTALGNAVVPQIPELIGRAILASLEADREAA